MLYPFMLLLYHCKYASYQHLYDLGHGLAKELRELVAFLSTPFHCVQGQGHFPLPVADRRDPGGMGSRKIMGQ